MKKQGGEHFVLTTLFMIFLLVSGQEEEGNEVKGEDSEGLGSAEMIAIAVCGLVIFAFILICIVMIRNAQRKKQQGGEGENTEL